MTAVELLAITVVFTTGVITGIVLLVSAACRKEDHRQQQLSREAPDNWTQAGRFLTGLYVRRPGDDSPRLRYPDDDPAEFSGPR